MRRLAPMVALAVLSACATPPPMGWIRTDGRTFTDEQIEVERTVCRGRMQQSNLAGFPSESIPGAFQRGRAVTDVFNGCMAERGYVLRPMN